MITEITVSSFFAALSIAESKVISKAQWFQHKLDNTEQLCAI